MPFLALAIGVSGVFAGTPQAPIEDDPVAPWVRTAIAVHPDAQAARDDLLAARERVRSARAWMPPSGQFTYKSDGTKELALSQMLPAPGKTASQVDVAARRIETARADSAARLLRLELSVREAAWMEWMAWEILPARAHLESLAVTAAATARRLQAQGMATAAQSWLADAKIRKVRQELADAFASAQSATAMRETWTGPADRFAAGPALAPGWDDAALAASSRSRPDIETMHREAAMELAMGQAMRASGRPDFMVGGMVMQMPDGMPGWGAMAGMTMPFAPWSRGMAEGEAASSRARSRAMLAKASSMERMARAEALDHAAKARAAWSALRELDSLLPAQENAVADARARYAQAREMQAMVLQMEEMVAMTRMEAIMRRGAYELERARHFAAAGRRPGPDSTILVNPAPRPVAEVTP